QFVANIDASFVKGIEDRRPAACQLVKGFLDQTSRALGERIKERPGECAGEGRVFGQAEVLRGFCGPMQLLNSPFLTGFWVVVHGSWGKAIQHGVVDRVSGDKLTLQMG